MVRLLLMLLVLLVSSTAQAQALAVRTTKRQCFQNGCRQIIGDGSCAYIGNADGKSVYITASHVVENADAVYVGCAGRWWTARVVQRYDGMSGDAPMDYAIIETQMIPLQKCFEVASEYPDSGVAAVAYGYSRGISNLRVENTRIKVRSNWKGISTQMAQGDSGGPIIADGKLVGIISGGSEDPNMTLCTDASLIRVKLLSRYRVLPRCNCRPRIRCIPTQPIQPRPDPLFIDNSEQVKALESEVAKLRAELDQLAKTQIPVWIVGEDGKPLKKKDEKGEWVEIKHSYNLGDPIKIRPLPVKIEKAKPEEKKQNSTAVSATQAVLQIFRGR